MKKIINEKGITLIALIITILVLLILAGVVFSLLSGNDGLLNKASDAGKVSKKAGENELIILNNYESIIDEFGNKGEVVQTKSIQEVNVGDYINYLVENGTDTNNGEFTILSSETGYTDNQTFNVNNGNNSWIVLSKDGGTIKIASTGSVLDKPLYLKGSTGTNNLENILRKISDYYVNGVYATDVEPLGMDTTHSASNSVSAINTRAYIDFLEEINFFPPIGWHLGRIWLPEAWYGTTLEHLIAIINTNGVIDTVKLSQYAPMNPPQYTVDRWSCYYSYFAF